MISLYTSLTHKHESLNYLLHDNYIWNNDNPYDGRLICRNNDIYIVKQRNIESNRHNLKLERNTKQIRYCLHKYVVHNKQKLLMV